MSARTKEVLAAMNKEFELEHSGDSDEELLSYVRQCEEKLKHTPQQTELIGGRYIAGRFGGWGKVIAAAKLPPAFTTPPALEHCEIYKNEFRRQARIFKRKREEERARRAEEQRMNAAAQQEELRMRTLRDMTWGLEHETDTDEQLLEYVRARAAEMGRSPRVKDVYGALYIVQRIGNWGVVLTLAGIKLPREVKKPREHEMAAYYRRKAAKEIDK